jgi:hypothetical protein
MNQKVGENLFSRYTETQKKRFKEFHENNPLVFEEFKNLAFKIKNTGRKKYSAEAILQVLRWHRDLQTTGEPFKISNNFRSMYARLLVHNYPEFKEFFTMHKKDLT